MAGVKDIAERAGVHETLVQRFFDAMADALSNGDTVIIREFGSFRLSHRKEREIFTPVMVEPRIRPAHDTVVFKPSDKLIEAVNK